MYTGLVDLPLIITASNPVLLSSTAKYPPASASANPLLRGDLEATV